MNRPARLVISLDFELFWGVRDHRELATYGRRLLGVRRAIPAMLELFQAYGVRATWATVGFLFCRDREELLRSLPRRLPAYEDLRLSPYSHVAEIGRDETEDPYHFAPSLLDRIAATEGQEIASHTFSHYYCLEEGQNGLDFEADLKAAIRVARDRGILLRSLVFPRNQVRREYLGICHRLGISAYRGAAQAWPYRTHRAGDNHAFRRLARFTDALIPLTGTSCVVQGSPPRQWPRNVPASRFLRPFAGRRPLLARRQRHRIFGELDFAARTGGIYHLWWHPHNFGIDLPAHLSELEHILRRFDGWRRLGRMESATMHDVVMDRRVDLVDEPRHTGETRV